MMNTFIYLIPCSVFGIHLVINSWLPLVLIILLLIIVAIAHRIRVSKLKHLAADLKGKLTEKEVLLQYSRENEKKAQEELIVSARTQQQLFTTLSRGIRNPMNGVLGMTTLLEGTRLSDEQQTYLQSIRDCSNDLVDTVSSIIEPNVQDEQQLHEPMKERKSDDKELKHLIDESFAQQYPLRILVAEDDPMNQQLAQMLLKRLGYSATIAQNGKEVLEVVSETAYDLILMDVEMPEMNGLEATRMIRLCLDRQPVIVAMTANAMDGDRENCLRAGMEDYLSKPVNMNDLMKTLQRWSERVNAA